MTDLSALIARVEEGTPEENLTCQFCGETDFDGYGLKLHLTLGWCRVFEELGPQNESLRAIQSKEGPSHDA